MSRDMREHLFNTGKIEYIRGKKPDVPCILCSLVERDPRLELLEVYRGGLCMVS